MFLLVLLPVIWFIIQLLVRLYKAYVLPHLEYCSPLLLGVGNAETTKIETTNYFILRTILGYSKSVSYDFLLKMADIKSLEKRRQFQSLVMLYRCLYDKGAPYISEFFVKDLIWLDLVYSQRVLRGILGGGVPTGPYYTQGPEEMYLSLEHQNPSKTSEKWVILIALQFRYTFYRPQTKRLRACTIGLQ